MFIQIIEMIENQILSGVYSAGELIISTPKIATLRKVNPATAQRAIAVLTDRGIVYKKRGIGMAVTEGAKAQILRERKKEFFKDEIAAFVDKAKKIGVTEDELIQLVKEHFHD